MLVLIFISAKYNFQPLAPTGAELLHAFLAALAGALRRAADPEGPAWAAAGPHPQAHWSAGSGENPYNAGTGC
jgi:hypothetical protein